MEKVILSNEEYMELLSKKPDFDGSEGNLYKVGSRLYKLDHNPYSYSDIRLEEIISFQPKIKHTQLPLGAIYFNTQFIGAVLHPFDASSFETIFTRPLPFKIQKLKELSRNLQELTKQNLILDDLFQDNIVITKEEEVQLIDIDGNNCHHLKSPEQLQILLKQFRTLILECCIPGFTFLDINKIKHKVITAPQLSYDLLAKLLKDFERNPIISQYQKTIK